MAKVKRMMFGGAAKGAAARMQGAAKQVVASKTAPKQMQFMSDKLRGAPMTGPLGSAGKPSATPPAGLNVAGIRKASAGLGDTFPRKSAPPPAFPAKSGSGDAAAALRKLPMNPPRPKTASPSPMQSAAKQTPAYAKPYADALAKQRTQQGALDVSNALRKLPMNPGAPRTMGALMKKGGAVKKKATKK